MYSEGLLNLYLTLRIQGARDSNTIKQSNPGPEGQSYYLADADGGVQVFFTEYGSLKKGDPYVAPDDADDTPFIIYP